MEQIELFHVESPCRGICTNSKKGFCIGCLRSREERFHWHQMDEIEKRKTIQLCKGRWQKLNKAREARIAALSLSSVELPYGLKEGDIQPSLYHFDHADDKHLASDSSEEQF